MGLRTGAAKSSALEDVGALSSKGRAKPSSEKAAANGTEDSLKTVTAKKSGEKEQERCEPSGMRCSDVESCRLGPPPALRDPAVESSVGVALPSAPSPGAPNLGGDDPTPPKRR